MIGGFKKSFIRKWNTAINELREFKNDTVMETANLYKDIKGDLELQNHTWYHFI